jgi:SM-20-related protein
MDGDAEMAQAAARTSTELSADDLFDYARLAATPLRTDPYGHVLVEDFVTEAARPALIRDYPAITGPGNVEPGDVPHGPAFDLLLGELESDRFRDAIAAKFGLDLSRTEPTIGLRSLAEATDGRIHHDHRSKIITLLLYFNESWDAAGGKLRICRNEHDIEDYTTEVEPLSGTLIAFHNTPTSWHGHKQHVGVRKMLQLSFRDMSGTVGIERKISRITKPIRRMLNMS